METTATRLEVTYGQVVEFRIAAEKFLQYHPHDVNMLTYALNKMQKKTKSIQEEFVNLREKQMIHYASKDEQKNVIREENEYKFTPENKIKLEEKLTQLYNQTIEIEPHLVDPEQWPATLNLTWINAFTGFVIKELSEEEFLNLKLGPTTQAQQLN